MKQLLNTVTQFLRNQLHLLMFMLVNLLVVNATAQDVTKETYLKANSEIINIEGTSPFSLFDKAFYDNQIFITSESHGYAKPHEVDFELFKQINKKTGARYYIAEIDNVQADKINQYLLTGNEDLLTEIYTYWYNDKAQWGCKAGFKKWQKMYAFNKTLAANKKIIVLGLDNLQDKEMTVVYLQKILIDSKYKKGTNVYMDSIQSMSYSNLNKDTTRKFVQFFRRAVSTLNLSDAKKILNKNYYAFNYTINNIASKKDRETKILDNFLSQIEAYKITKEKFYGFWGRFHAMQDSINGDLSFSARIKSKGFKVASIPVFCIESASMLPTDYLPAMVAQKGTIFSKVDMVNDDSFIYKVAGIGSFKNVTIANTITLFKLNTANSPYITGLDLVNSKSDFDATFNWNGAKNSNTTNYMQYAVLVRGSAWADPYGDNKSNK
jgi:hypothetical protein